MSLYAYLYLLSLRHVSLLGTGYAQCADLVRPQRGVCAPTRGGFTCGGTRAGEWRSGRLTCAMGAKPRPTNPRTSMDGPIGCPRSSLRSSPPKSEQVPIVQKPDEGQRAQRHEC